MELIYTLFGNRLLAKSLSAGCPAPKSADLAKEFEIASAIIAARTQAGLTQSELAQKMGAKQSQIARWEGGEQNATKTLMRIAEATGTHLKISFEKTQS